MIHKALPLNPRKRYTWGLEIMGFIFAHFQKCNMPEIEVEVAEFNSAGTLHPIKTASRVKFNDVECEKMMLSEGADLSAYQWLKQVADVTTGIGLPPSVYKKDVDIIHFNRSGVPIDRWTLHGAFVSKIGYEDLEGGNKDDMIEKITITYDNFTRLL